MNSLYPEIIRDIDKYIKGKMKIEDIELTDIPMYFIPKDIKKQNNNPKILPKIINKLMSIIRK